MGSADLNGFPQHLSRGDIGVLIEVGMLSVASWTQLAVHFRGDARLGEESDFPVEQLRIKADGSAKLDLGELSPLDEFADETGRDRKSLGDLFGGQ